MPSHSLRIGLFDPGMTHLHRVGLAGLYMTLSQLDPADLSSSGSWELDSQGVELAWVSNPRSLVERIVELSFAVTREGLIDFLAHRDHPMGDLQRVLLHNAIMRTYLQHGQSRKTEKADRHISIRFEDKVLTQRVKSLKEYSHQKVGSLFTRKGDFRDSVSAKGWLLPGGAVRHVGFQSETAIAARPGESLCLWCAPIASLYYLILGKRADGEYDGRKGAAIVLPHIRDLAVYSRCYRRYLGSPLKGYTPTAWETPACWDCFHSAHSGRMVG
jgi:CRISPR-associated protein Cas8a1/Csx13